MDDLQTQTGEETQTTEQTQTATTEQGFPRPVVAR